MDVKTITRGAHAKSFYDPNRCRNPIKENKTKSISFNETSPIPNNSIHANRVLNHKKSA